MRILILAICVCFLTACLPRKPTYTPTKNVDARVENLMKTYDARSVGIGIIRGGELVWTGYYGEERPGTPVDAESMFNTASVNKALTAEVALRLASRGVIDLDEPISAYYIHPDLKDDKRHRLLTPRLLLTHQAGFLNWPYLYEDEKLAFIAEPGNGEYNYAGIGYRIFGKFLEAKLDTPFPQIVKEEVFLPLQMAHATNSHDAAKNRRSIVLPVDASGEFKDGYDFEENYWSAADDLFVSVEDFARFLISTLNNEAVSPEMVKARATIQTEIGRNEVWRCGKDAVDPCPSPYGHGIGWFVFGFESGLVLHHGGNDKSEAAIAYFEPETGDGGIIFINSPKGLQLWPELVDVVDPAQNFQNVFHDLIDRFFPAADP